MRRHCITRVLYIIITVLLFLTLTSASAFAIKDRYEVVIDPAHGGSDSGVILTRSVSEKEVTLAIAKMIKQNLDKTENIRVKLTRSTDTDISIRDRKKMVDKATTDLFVSIHINAGFGNKSAGYEIYYTSSKRGTSSGETGSKEIVEDMIESRYINDSILFAQLAQRNIEKVFPREGRGIRSAPVFVLDGLSVPAIEIELGFATHIKSKKKLADEEIQKSIADGLSKSIKEFFTSSGE
ncbi:MAG: N-acetylmuramoyl-L-alanine amidase [Deltaproteobacteria bacterium]|nr:N-acetylmuramoyl-L-alanine amidase [Deltaproteobacteria bacterium]MBN2845351.1 N-acetylmuramoyl-L-alanine amidase [Deltaproteobacteria bacterium]